MLNRYFFKAVALLLIDKGVQYRVYSDRLECNYFNMFSLDAGKIGISAPDEKQYKVFRIKDELVKHARNLLSAKYYNNNFKLHK